MPKPIVGVMGAGQANQEVCAAARQLGLLIAQRGWILLNGGRNVGVMAASAQGARQAGGTVIGILPDRDAQMASPDLDFAIVTGLGDGRNVINALSSDVMIALPGGAGTLSKIALALKNGKRVILLGWELGPPFEVYRRNGMLTTAASPEKAVTDAAAVLEQGRCRHDSGKVDDDHPKTG